MAVNWKPFRTLFLWTWLGRLEKPTKPMSFLRITGDAAAFWEGTREGLEVLAYPF